MSQMCERTSRNGKPCRNKARFRGLWRESFSREHWKTALFCGTHATYRMCSKGWHFEDLCES